jgi:gliding motility-associated protein GldC
MKNEIVKTSKIEVQVGLNENQVPVKMNWSATDGNVSIQETKALLFSVWDPNENQTLKIDLWTTEMSVEEMKQFFHQTLLTMADSFEKATGETLICEDLRDYCYHFAEKMNILPE